MQKFHSKSEGTVDQQKSNKHFKGVKILEQISFYHIMSNRPKIEIEIILMEGKVSFLHLSTFDLKLRLHCI